MALFVATALLALVLIKPGWPEVRRHLGKDFLPFYVAGTLAREGRHADLYDLDVVRQHEHAIACDNGIDVAPGTVGPWWNPPPYAWAFAPLSRLPFPRALLAWTALNLAALAAAAWVLCRLTRPPNHEGLPQPAGVTTTLLVLFSAPCVAAIAHGQNTPISLLLVALVALAARGGHGIAAGLLTGLLLYKPQLAAVVAAVLVIRLGFRAAIGILFVASVALLLTVLTMPGALGDYLHRMPENLRFMQVDNPYLWERHVTLKAFWRLLLQGRGAGETSVAVNILTWLCALPLLAGLAATAVGPRRSPATHGSTGAVLAAAVAATPLLVPFYFDYDLLLLAVPLALLASDVRARQPTTRLDRWVTAVASLLYLWLFVNPFVGESFRVNLAVPLLALLSTLLIVRAWRTGQAADAAPVRPVVPEPAPATLSSPEPNFRRLFWLAGGAIALFIFTLTAGGPVFDKGGDGKRGWGYDFLPAYVAGHFARTGQPNLMYDRGAFAEVQNRVIREADLASEGRFAASLNPPHFALMYAPLSALPYRTAAAVWLALNVLMYGGGLLLLMRMLPPAAQVDWKQAALVPLLVTASMPFCQAAGHQQNTFLSLLLLCTVVTFWRAGRGVLAGITAGLLFYKPQLALVLSVVLVLDMGLTAFFGLGLTGAALLFVSEWTMPGAIWDYLWALPGNLDVIQNKLQYNWGRQVTLLGFWRLLIQGRKVGAPDGVARLLWAVSSLAVAAGFLVALHKSRRARRADTRTAAPARDRLIAAAAACTPLLLPYFMDYDLLLLSVPAVLFAGDVMRRGLSRTDRLTTYAWVAVYLWAYLNPGVSGMIRVTLTVPLLAAIAVALAARCMRSDEPRDVNQSTTPREDPPQDPPVRAVDQVKLQTPSPLPRAA